MTYHTYDIQPKAPARPNEAERIEVARTRLMVQSERARTGNDRFPSLTARRLAGSALYLAHSNAPLFEKLHTLNTAAANLRARGVNERNMRTIARLSQRALEDAYPETDDPAANDLRQLEIRARQLAIEHTTPTTPFPVALEEAWTELGHPIDPLIHTTERINRIAWEAKLRRARLELQTETTIDDELLNPTSAITDTILIK